MGKGTKELDEYIKRLERFEKDIPKMMTELAAQEGEVIAGMIKKRTPVVTGHLRDSFHSYTSPLLNSGKSATVWITNNTEYASYVERGHSQQPGRYVPALGKRLVKGWVNGRFMVRISMRIYKEKRMRPNIRRFIDKKLTQHGLN